MAQNSNRAGNYRGLINVVVARFSALGDVAMSVPVIYSACRCYPDVRFIFVTRPAMTGIFVNAPENLCLVGADVRNDYVGAAGIYRLVRELTAEYRPDCFIDLHDVLRTRLMRIYFKLRGVKTVALNKGRAHKRALTRRHNKVMLPLISSRARYREAFFSAGMPLSERFHGGLYGGHGVAPAANFATICDPKPDGAKWIGIAPFAAHTGKIYPVDMMEKVIAQIADECPDAKIFFFGGDGIEQQILTRWATALPDAVSLAGKRYGFPAELALINHLDVMLTMDSANMHLASIVSTPTVSVWGATHPYCGFKGWHTNDDDTVQLPMTCRPCSVFGNKPCHRGDYLCLTAIRPEMIARKVLEKIQ